MVGMGCAACHVRQINVGAQAYRIDGGPAFADFGAMVTDLDAAMRNVVSDDAAFQDFAGSVLGAQADESAVAILRTEVELWVVRFHTIISRSLPQARPWGPSRLDAIGMIYNRVAGLDLGPAPTYLLPDNIQRADAPTRYPFLWNAARQDVTQWTGFAENGNDFLALARNLGQLYGVFGTFHPQATDSSLAMLDRNYLADNSANVVGLGVSEKMVEQLGPPVWPWPIDKKLAKRGETIFDRPVAAGGCVACHGVKEGLARPPSRHTLRTPVLDVGTDTRQWQVLLRRVKTGSLEGASIPGVMEPLPATDLALHLLKAAIVGSLVEVRAMNARAAMPMGDDATARRRTMAAVEAMPHAQMDGTMKLRMMPSPDAPKTPMTNLYEARVLQGIWAAAPYLHNGSVPTLADLLKPPTARPHSFKIGPAYDLETVGLAKAQTAVDFTLRTTGCEDRASGDSHCGHDYGTRLPSADKKALLEYLKTL